MLENVLNIFLEITFILLIISSVLFGISLALNLPHDGEFRDNVILQSKNGPLDFQPREPYAPIFDQMTKTTQMAELQITQEYLGHSQQLVFLAPMWEESKQQQDARRKPATAQAPRVPHERLLDSRYLR